MATLVTLLALAAGVAAHDDMNGMDMSMDGAMSLASGQMLTYLHFTPGDILWFQGWVPKSTGAMVGACIGLFLLAILERWIACIRALADMAWWRSAQEALADKRTPQSLPAATNKPERKGKTMSLSSVPVLPSVPSSQGPRASLPFIPTNDIPRGIIHAVQSALSFAFMLAVMTYQVGFIFAIVVGLGVGETLFGRYTNMGAHLV
ncbi:hypothetical protein GLOTRDRAFT_138434 [Gloeophyllum trabeum ATCC 11539]|uniref:Copper transport protein n=1 Tax=Gloeophyllum trabeum (strain ATCC 11539 / FP-39264 / Madison 617) TaxID=670483 RepID=S7Q7W6_GLOTA|nr:uncharacterized protein GLOTRDRAFT_138434 [Gloeophyllum trabeum ATCC 11539]EPQ55533.1 hypothetical protein GLOTRDRAFT_138434 [Gloeophyllum trabeum ATCC 11539]